MKIPALSDVALADHPDPELADELELFGQFVGSWDLDVVYHEPAGERRVSAEWHFAWALNGRAVQDVWISPNLRDRDNGHKGFDWGTTIRFYDPRIGAWRSTWMGPVKGLVIPFIARRVDDEIVLEHGAPGEAHTRWIFADIAHESFRWRAVESHDGGQTWVLVQEMWRGVADVPGPMSAGTRRPDR